MGKRRNLFYPIGPVTLRSHRGPRTAPFAMRRRVIERSDAGLAR